MQCYSVRYHPIGLFSRFTFVDAALRELVNFTEIFSAAKATAHCVRERRSLREKTLPCVFLLTCAFRLSHLGARNSSATSRELLLAQCNPLENTASKGQIQAALFRRLWCRHHVMLHQMTTVEQGKQRSVVWFSVASLIQICLIPMRGPFRHAPCEHCSSLKFPQHLLCTI